MTQIQAAIKVLRDANEPMTIKEIWAEIQRRKLWTSGGGSPEQTLRTEMRKRCIGEDRLTRRLQTPQILFRQADDGLYELIDDDPPASVNSILASNLASDVSTSPQLQLHKAENPILTPPIQWDEAEYAYQPTDLDSREIARRAIRARRGQSEFRDSIITHYGGRCLISGCTVLDVLEAAHIKPYRGKPDNHVDNGLLLRSDLHTLFDADLLGIDPNSLLVKLHDTLTDSEYGDFSNKPLECGANRPSEAALRIRWRDFERRMLPPKF